MKLAEHNRNKPQHNELVQHNGNKPQHNGNSLFHLRILSKVF